jgi:hypothetical protein
MFNCILGDMADSNNASNGGKDYMMRNNWERNYPVTTKGMTDPEHYHYDRSEQNPDLLRPDLLIHVLS